MNPSTEANLTSQAEFFKALGHPARLLILSLVQVKPRHGEELAVILNLTPATISHHLALLSKAGLTSSLGEARRLIRGGGAKVNDEPVTDELRKLGPGDVNAQGVIKLSAGRKRHALIRPV